MNLFDYFKFGNETILDIAEILVTSFMYYF